MGFILFESNIYTYTKMASTDGPTYCLKGNELTFEVGSKYNHHTKEDFAIGIQNLPLIYEKNLENINKKIAEEKNAQLELKRNFGDYKKSINKQITAIQKKVDGIQATKFCLMHMVSKIEAKYIDDTKLEVDYQVKFEKND